MFELNGKTAIVTGAGGYIGSEVAVTLAKQGAKVAVCDLNEQAIENTLARIREIGGEAKGYLLDVTDSQSVNQTVDSVCKDFGGVDISVHVAGGSARLAGANRYARIVDQADEVIDKVLKVNLYGAIYLARASGKKMIEQGRGGRIISFSSAVGLNGLAYCGEYGASKGGVVAFTKTLAKEVGEYGITANSVCPGVVMRPEETGGDGRALGTNFLKRKCLASDVAGFVAYLVSPEAGFVTGQNCVIDGGRTLAMKGTD